jgi:hypothetical protein
VRKTRGNTQSFKNTPSSSFSLAPRKDHSGEVSIAQYYELPAIKLNKDKVEVIYPLYVKHLPLI